MKFGNIASNLVDLRTGPRFNSERASQCFWGEPVKILRESSGYSQVEQTDGYTGWVRSDFVARTDRAYFRELSDSCNFVVASKSARLYDLRHGRPIEPYLLYYGTRLCGRPGPGESVKIRLGNSFLFSVKKAHLKPINGSRAASVTGSNLVAEARKFLGVPYLWGGVTSVGFDCSGLVRTVLSRFNLYVPRDTKDQVFAGERVERECIKTGDLLFFKRHVGFAIGDHRLIHASAGGNGVRINSLKRTDPDYREDLAREFAQARRII
jgi:hypothetical protein